MTARQTLPPDPQSLAQRFVMLAQRVVSRCLACSLEDETQRARLRFVVVVGGGWALSTGERLLGSGMDADLAVAAGKLTKAAVSELDVESKARLLASMDDKDSEVPGYEPPSFRVRLDLQDAQWTLSVLACARHASAVVARAEGCLEELAQQAA